MKNLVKKFQNISYQYNLWTKGSKIVLGVSGGPDSTCMLDIFAKLQKKYELELIVAHVNYGLRGKDSDGDERFVRKLAEKYSIGAKLLKIKELSSYGKRTPSENELRNIRYDFFEKVRVKNNFDLIAVGHTLDDQAETLLMRLIRGSGLAGLSAIKHKNNKIIRPLLGITKREIIDYLNRTNGVYRTDRTNKEIPFLRNKIRNKLIPLLEKKYNPNIKETLYKSSLNVAEDYALIDELAERYYQKHKELRVSNILKLHPSLQKRIILKAIENIRPNSKDIESAHVNEILKILKSVKSKRQIVKFQSLKIVKKGDKLIIQKL